MVLEFKDFRNESGLKFTDISSEKQRVYFKGNEVVLVVDSPVALYVSNSGGHRIVGGDGRCRYLKPEAWDIISWTVKEGQPHFVA